MEFSPFVGPDSLRAMTQLMKALFENHTPRVYGYEDIEGSYYEGTVENWGAESLMESRKLLLDKPALKNILIENTFDYYFDVQYAGFVNTYDQQNMLCAILRKDVLLSNRTYRLKFENLYPFSVPRSQSSSDPNIIRDNFLLTLTPPTLIEDNDGTITNHELRLTDKTGLTTVYFFHVGVETEDFIGEVADGEMTTEPITDSMNGFPMIWACVDVLKTLPDVRFEGNEYGEDELPILTIGTNGHDVSYVYPFLSLADTGIDLNKILIKILPTENAAFIVNTSYEDGNYETNVYEIQILIYDEDVTEENIDTIVTTAPTTGYYITYNDQTARMTINNDPSITWHFRLPVDGDYDYDGTTYTNRAYAYTRGSQFTNNISDNTVLALLKLHMYDENIYPAEYLSLNTYAGTHVDITSDYSDNGVSKKNGVIHNLCEFDGLPLYFNYNLKRNQHRAHVEMYALRDKKNSRNQKSTDKPTAAVIVDSAVPQVEIPDIENDLPLTIVFDRRDEERRHFVWDPLNPPVSKFNILSEINYVDMYHLGNARIQSQKDKKKLVYHGNRHFSLSSAGFDPDLEYGRVYIISNDDAKYDNNEQSEHPKAPTTFARICDIPTDFRQLISLPGICPTFIFDSDYVRTEVPYCLEDVDYILNKKNLEHFANSDGMVIFNRNNTSRAIDALNESFDQWINLVSWVNLNNTTGLTFSINGGESAYYEIGDRFDFNIGGINIKGEVSGATDGVVTSVLYLNENTGNYNETSPVLKYDYMNIVNLEGPISTFDTTTKTGNGTGLKIVLTIDQTYYESLERDTDGQLSNLYYFFKDDLSNISIYDYDNDTYEQITGYTEYKNSYDTGRSRIIGLTESFLDLCINNEFRSYESIPQTNVWVMISSNISKSESTGFNDLSDRLNADRVTYQDSYFILDNKILTSEHARILRFADRDVYSTDNDFIYPNYQDLNLPRYQQKTNFIKMTTPDVGQPTLMIFDPKIDKIYTYDHSYNRNLRRIYSVKPMTFKDKFTDQATYRYDDVVDSQGYLTTNVYAYNESYTGMIDEYVETLNELERDQLIEMISDMNPKATPLMYENDQSLYKYTKEMLIDYLVENKLYWGPDNVAYSECPMTIYRKNGTRLLGKKAMRVLDKDGNPIEGIEQPTGDTLPITINNFNPNGKLGVRKIEIQPSFIFKVDDANPGDLNNFRLYDDDGYDITEESIIIIDANMYMANISPDDSVTWVKINKRGRTE